MRRPRAEAGPARGPESRVASRKTIVLGRRHPRERLIEQDLSDLFRTHRWRRAAWRCSSWRRRGWSSASPTVGATVRRADAAGR